MVPAHPDYGRGDRAVDLSNEIAQGQPGYWCLWTPCPHGCCLGWNGHEKFYAGPAWMEYLIGHFLRPEAHAEATGDAQFAEFTFNHRLDGLVVGEQDDNRELFAIRVDDNVVSQQVLQRGEPLPFEPGWNGRFLDDQPWLPARRGRRFDEFGRCLAGTVRVARRHGGARSNQGADTPSARSGH